MTSGGTPWADWFAYAVGALGISPQGFWRLSLWEWLALAQTSSPRAPTRGELEALMRAHPDSG